MLNIIAAPIRSTADDAHRACFGSFLAIVSTILLQVREIVSIALDTSHRLEHVGVQRTCCRQDFNVFRIHSLHFAFKLLQLFILVLSL